MKIVYLGSGEFGLWCLDALQRSRHRLELVVTSPGKRSGRGMKTKPTAVARWAGRQGVACMETDDVNAPASMQRISSTEPDLLVVIAFGQYVRRSLRQLPVYECINVHASLLPSYRGAAPINRAIMAGEKETGVSIIRVAAKMDAGDILSACSTTIAEDETAGELHDRLRELAAQLLLDTIQSIEEGTVRPVPQDDSRATSAPRLNKRDGYIDFAAPALAVKCMIHGLWPWPAATVDYVRRTGGKATRVSIARAQVVTPTNVDALEPGTLDEDLNVACKSGRLCILEIKPAGGSLMSFKSFVNGRQCAAGDRFVKVSG